MKSNVPQYIHPLNVLNCDVIAKVEAHARSLFVEGRKAGFQLGMALIVQHFSISPLGEYEKKIYQPVLGKEKELFKKIADFAIEDTISLCLIDAYYKKPLTERPEIIKQFAACIAEQFKNLEIYTALCTAYGQADTVFKNCMMYVLYQEALAYLETFPALSSREEKSNQPLWRSYSNDSLAFVDDYFPNYNANRLRGLSKGINFSIGSGPHSDKEVERLLDVTIYNPKECISDIVAIGNDIVSEDESKKMDHFDFINYFLFSKGAQKRFGQYKITVQEKNSDSKASCGQVVLKIEKEGKLPRVLTVHFFRGMEGEALAIDAQTNKELQVLYFLMKAKKHLFIHSAGGQGRAAYLAMTLLLAHQAKHVFIENPEEAARRIIWLVNKCREDNPEFLWTPTQLACAIRNSVSLKIDCDVEYLKVIVNIFRNVCIQSSVLHSSSPLITKPKILSPCALHYQNPVQRVKNGL